MWHERADEDGVPRTHGGGDSLWVTRHLPDLEEGTRCQFMWLITSYCRITPHTPLYMQRVYICN